MAKSDLTAGGIGGVGFSATIRVVDLLAFRLSGIKWRGFFGDDKRRWRPSHDDIYDINDPHGIISPPTWSFRIDRIPQKPRHSIYIFLTSDRFQRTA